MPFLILFVSCAQDSNKRESILPEMPLREKTYFLQTVFDFDSKYIIKFKGTELTYSVHGAFNEVHIRYINNLMNNLSHIKNLPKFNLVEKNGGIDFYMPLDLSEFDKGKSFKEPIHGYCRSQTTFEGYKSASQIIVKPFQKDIEVEQTLRHELMHALGLMGHPGKEFYGETTALGRLNLHYSDSFDSIPPVLPKLDSVALSILYRPDVHIKLDKDNTSRLLGLK